MTTDSITLFRALGTPLRGAVGRTARHVSALMQTWRRRAADRHYLSNMNKHLLYDIGVRSDELERELRKPFWRP